VGYVGLNGAEIGELSGDVMEPWHRFPYGKISPLLICPPPTFPPRSWTAALVPHDTLSCDPSYSCHNVIWRLIQLHVALDQAMHDTVSEQVSVLGSVVFGA
jgi:hypothetical protein